MCAGASTVVQDGVGMLKQLMLAATPEDPLVILAIAPLVNIASVIEVPYVGGACLCVWWTTVAERLV